MIILRIGHALFWLCAAALWAACYVVVWAAWLPYILVTSKEEWL